MELDFRDFYEGWKGGLLGAGAGFVAGGGSPLSYPLSALGGWLGHKLQKAYGNQYGNYPVRADPKYFVYYKDIDGRVVKELLPNEYIPLDEDKERLNGNKDHPYYYFNKCIKKDETGRCVQVKMVTKTKAGYQNYQRRVRTGGYGYGYGQQQRGYGPQRRI